MQEVVKDHPQLRGLAGFTPVEDAVFLHVLIQWDGGVYTHRIRRRRSDIIVAGLSLLVNQLHIFSNNAQTNPRHLDIRKQRRQQTQATSWRYAEDSE